MLTNTASEKIDHQEDGSGGSRLPPNPPREAASQSRIADTADHNWAWLDCETSEVPSFREAAFAGFPRAHQIQIRQAQ